MGLKVYPWNTRGFYDDRWDKPAPGPSIFIKRTLLSWSSRTWMIWGAKGNKKGAQMIRWQSQRSWSPTVAWEATGMVQWPFLFTRWGFKLVDESHINWGSNPIGSMVLQCMVTWIPLIYPLYVSIYTSTMDPMGINIKSWMVVSIMKLVELARRTS